MFSNVMKKMLALALSLTFVLALVPATASAAEGTFAEMFSGAITVSSDYDADTTDDIAAVTVAEETVTLRVWSTLGCSSVYHEATMTLKNTSGDGLTVKFDFDLKGYYQQVKLGDFTFTTSGVAEVTLGIDEEIDITLYSDGSNDNEDTVENGEAVLTLANFVLTPFHICTGTLVEGEDADCENDGWADYYECSCEKLYADEACTNEITDLDEWKKDAGKIAHEGHKYTEQKKDAAHIKTENANCTQSVAYWYDCSVCDANAKDDSTAADKFWVSTDKGEHKFEEKLEDEKHLVSGTGANCQDAKEYYFDCLHCEEIGTATWRSDSSGEHSFTEKIADEKHLVSGTGVNCQDAKEYYFDCLHCAEIGTATWISDSCGEHSFTEKLEDEKHLVSGTGVNCQDAKEYYFDCLHCAEIGTTTWKSDSCGEHSFTEKIADEKHFVSGTGANCQDAKEYYFDCLHCAEIGTTTWKSDEVGNHEFDLTQWGYKDKESGHAHKCKYCTEHDNVLPHNPNINVPTETEDKICIDCQIVLETATGHVCENHLIKISAISSTCTQEGNIEYYECSCGKYYTDSSAEIEITDKNSVKIQAGHKYGDFINEELPIHTADEQKNGMKGHYFCDECDTYFTEEKVATTKDALVVESSHNHGTEWKFDEESHWNECVCGDKTNGSAHNDDNNDGTCDACNYVVVVEPDNTPKPGDNSMIALWSILMGISTLACLIFIKKRKAL